MRYSQIFAKTSKTAPSDADCVNAKLLTQGGFVLKQMAGVYNYLPLGLRVLNKIQNIIREEMNALGANEILMPALTQAENYQITKRDNLDILFHLQGRDESELVLNQSHEEVVTPLAQKYAFSYRDLPMAVYQIQNKFRNEPRAKSGLLRGREFNMKDMYSFHANKKSLDEFYEKAVLAYFKIYERLGLGELTVKTYASGGSFSKYSHEFQTVHEVGEDTVYLCSKCRVAVNKEIYHEQNTCPECGAKDLEEKKAIEVGNIFKLGTRFSDVFGFRYADEHDKQQSVEMGCYGMGPSRVMGALAEIFHDERGLIWPQSVAPYQVHLLDLGADEEIKTQAEKLYQKLLADGVEALFDDRSVSAGAKLADADLIGCPTRVVISKKTLAQDSVEVKKRNEAEAKLVKTQELKF
ncbi:MAG: prolyl-tRNA synthetase [Candidatus Magasanikbacteria bacterium CG10_big_fil_rev_8_21_14_0_10_40_10]|uniref:Proline--tRNA ligase n=1 Tax=Candidatus Magasanikbacteria bacterium CG10_big_fil_rev_8_21_14_0_10_40_10 TaxID=1974648 RepID=A0A2M6W3R9_9BACT|nr:MAG: prolyl-tRNA synthetase [Candidatus Magasanikbacteria bacterium CG10_big_fil_rev_8_21_14_0_10_40_10]